MGRTLILPGVFWLVLCRCALGGQWVDVRVVGPLVIRAEFPLDRYEPLCRELAALQDDLVRQLGIPRAEERIEIYLFADRRSYTIYMQQYMPEMPARRALYVKQDGPGRVFAYRAEHLATDLRHETTHALLHAVLPMVPLWLDEGLAEYFEVPRERRVSGSEYMSAVRWSARLGVATEMSHLERLGEAAEMDAAQYQAAWAWVHFMLNGPVPAREELIDYLADLRERRRGGPLSSRLAGRLDDPAASLKQHFRQARWSAEAPPPEAGQGRAFFRLPILSR